MTAERIHHPACSSRWGGLCTSCPSVTKAESTHEPDITCEACGETYIIAGETIPARRAALAAWEGCCTPNAEPSATSPRTVRQAARVESAPTPLAATQRTSLPRALTTALLADVTRNLSAVRSAVKVPGLSGVPAFVARRWAVGR